MVYDWNAPKNMPWLMVASIGGLIGRQGTISEAEWNRFKTEALSLQRQDLENGIAAVERRIRDGAKLNYEIMKRKITEMFVSDSDSVTFMIDLAVETEFGSMDVWCTSKLLYTDRSIVTVYLFVPKKYPDALRVLKSLAQGVSAP